MMLSPVAALLLASALPMGAAQPVSVTPVSVTPSVVAAAACSAVCSPILLGLESGNGRFTVDAALLRALGPQALLGNLELLSRAELRRFASENTGVVRQLIAAPPGADSVRTWWAGLTNVQREMLSTGVPELIGNLEGLPYTVRDTANRRFLAEELDRLRGTLAGLGKGARDTTFRDIAELEKVAAALGGPASSPPRRLLTLDTTGSIRAAISFGDLQTADFVSVLVPGMYMSVATTIGPWTDTAARVYDDQVSFQRLFRDSRTVATVSWIGYQTPDIASVFTPALAEEGAAYLANAVNGLKAMRGAKPPYISLLAHSYGATAAMMALERNTMSVDALGIVGSPGSSAKTASALAVPAGKVWVGEAAWDPVVNSGFYGSDPGSPAYGAKKLSVAGTIDPITGETLRQSIGHNDYLEPGTESMRNLALIGIDKGQFVTDGTPTDRGKTLALARG